MNESTENMGEWVNVQDGSELTGYTKGHIRWLARHEKVRAIKVNPRAWLVHREDLLEHKRTTQPGRPKGSKVSDEAR